ncbi:MBL fold metallo-hydrolase, partial [Candidatus Dojkabacteria bacterium]|nr:MBL fold metallo-hydrolase [Candidatus Dojkabacteria bacterium]
MTGLTFFGGVGEIGGNKILVSDGQDKIFLDFGMSFSKQFKYFDAFLNPRKLNGMGDFYELGILPKIKGIYREDYLKHMDAEPEKIDCNGVFVSHAHADHTAHIHFLREDLPIYGTKETLKILESVEETSGTGFCEFVNLKRTFEFYKNKKGGYSRLKGENSKIPREIHTLEKPAQFDCLKVTSSLVNHSLPGATGFLVESNGGTIAYTGDLRFHGYGGHLTERFIKDATGSDILITEGTRIDRSTTRTEE